MATDRNHDLTEITLRFYSFHRRFLSRNIPRSSYYLSPACLGFQIAYACVVDVPTMLGGGGDHGDGARARAAAGAPVHAYDSGWVVTLACCSAVLGVVVNTASLLVIQSRSSLFMKSLVRRLWGARVFLIWIGICPPPPVMVCFWKLTGGCCCRSAPVTPWPWQVIVRNIGLVAYGEERESGPPTQAIAARIAVHHPCNRNPGAGAEPDF